MRESQAAATPVGGAADAADAGEPRAVAIAASIPAQVPALIHPAPDGGYWAEVPALPGCITEGDSLEEVRANLRDAVAG